MKEFIMAIDVSHVRRLVQSRLAEIKRTAATRRERIAAAEHHYAAFLASVATPVVTAVAQTLSAEGHPYRVITPGGSVRMTSDRSPRTYLDLRLDTSGQEPVVVAEVSRERGHRVLVDDRPIGAGQDVSALTEEDVLSVIVGAIGDLVER
jgi:hypothetical protein